MAVPVARHRVESESCAQCLQFGGARVHRDRAHLLRHRHGRRSRSPVRSGRDRRRAVAGRRQQARRVHRGDRVVAGLPGELRALNGVPVRVEHLGLQAQGVAQGGDGRLPRRDGDRGGRLRHRHRSRSRSSTRSGRDHRRAVADRHHQARFVHRGDRVVAARPSDRNPYRRVPVLVAHLCREVGGRAQSVQPDRRRAHGKRGRTGWIGRGWVLAVPASGHQSHGRQHDGQPDHSTMVARRSRWSLGG